MTFRFSALRVGLMSLSIIIGICLGFGSATIDALSAPPTTSIVLPSNNATLSGTQYFDATASPGTTEVQFELSGSGYVDHVIATATPTIYGWLAAVDTTSFYNDTYTLQSVATSGGLVSTSPGVSITFDNPGPAVNIVLPSGASALEGMQYLDAATGPGVRQVNYTLTGNGVNDQIFATGSPTIYGWLTTWNTTLVPNGNYTLQAIADATKGPNGFSIPLEITVYNPAPTTSVVLPQNGATVSGQFYVDAVASAGVTMFYFLFSGGPDNWSPRSINGAVPWIYGYWSDLNSTLVPGGMPNGTYTVQSEACYPGFVCGTSAPVTFVVDN